MATRTELVSSIPLTVRTKSDSAGDVRRHGSKRARNGFGGSTARYEDIMKETVISQDIQLPEDHLEDLISLPIAKELVPKRSRSKISMSSHATAGTTAFPAVDMGATSADQYHEASVQGSEYSDATDDPLPSRVTPPKRSDSLRKRAQSTPMKPASPPTRFADNVPSSSGMAKSESSDSAGSTKKPRRELGANGSPRQRAVTNNVVTPKKPPVTPRKPVSNPLNKSTNGSRQVSSPIRHKAQSTSTRQRSQSASYVRAEEGEYDPKARPPWMEEEALLYKSDIVAPAEGSLAYIALQAQNKHASHPTSSDEEDLSRAVPPPSNQKSWDDVILPAVARQLRAQQMEAALNQSKGDADDGELLVTDWNPDGSPRKWKRVGKKQKERMMQEEDRSPRALPAPAYEVSKGSTSILPTSIAQTDLVAGPSTPSTAQPQPDQEIEVISNQKSERPAVHPNASSLSVNRPRPSISTGRQELWDMPALASPGVARQNGFATQQQQSYQSFAGAIPQKAEKQAPKKQKQLDDDTHKGGCRCIIM